MSLSYLNCFVMEYCDGIVMEVFLLLWRVQAMMLLVPLILLAFLGEGFNPNLICSHIPFSEEVPNVTCMLYCHECVWNDVGKW